MVVNKLLSTNRH